LLAAELGFALLTEPDGVAVFWPAAGVSSGILIALGRDARRPAGAGVIVASIVAGLTRDRNIWESAALASCHTGEALLMAWLVERYFGARFNLTTVRNVLGLVAAAVVATIASATGAATYELFRSGTMPIWAIWHQWFLSDAAGIVAVAPLVIGLVNARREPPPRNEIIEGAAALATLAAVTVFIISLPQAPWQTVRPGALLFPVLLWVTARCEPVFAAAAAFMVSIAAVWTTAFGIGRFGDPAVPIVDRILSAQTAIAVFALYGYVLAALFAERRHDKQQRDLLIAELDHRVKNVLARVAAVVKHADGRSRTTEQFVRSVDGRIQSLAAAHSLLSKSRWCGVGLVDLLRRQLAPYTTDANLSLNGPDIILTPPETQTLAMVVHELVTNAAKYGALSNPAGNVSVSWDCTGVDLKAVLRILWRETGGPPILTAVQSSYGSSLIRDLIPYELGGTVELTFLRDGTCCKIEIPLKRRYVTGRWILAR
jgi:two-component sensor histidine kinase